jgi:hypothetical protein
VVEVGGMESRGFVDVEVLPGLGRRGFARVALSGELRLFWCSFRPSMQFQGMNEGATTAPC